MVSYFRLMQVRGHGVRWQARRWSAAHQQYQRPVFFLGWLMLIEEDVPELETVLVTHQGP